MYIIIIYYYLYSDDKVINVDVCVCVWFDWIVLIDLKALLCCCCQCG
jgi:hypothetical protein